MSNELKAWNSNGASHDFTLNVGNLGRSWEFLELVIMRGLLSCKCIIDNSMLARDPCQTIFMFQGGLTQKIFL